jgi:hypothetical protein
MAKKRLTANLNGHVGDATKDFPHRTGVLGNGPVGPKAGMVIDGVIYPLQGEPPTATTKGWGKVPGSK